MPLKLREWSRLTHLMNEAADEIPPDDRDDWMRMVLLAQSIQKHKYRAERAVAQRVVR